MANTTISQELAARGINADPYLGQVATRSFIPTQKYTLRSGNAQSGHIAADDISAIQLAYANWYSNAALHEAAAGDVCTYTASIQYPIGSAWQAFKWAGGANSGTAADGTTIFTDALTLAVAIPRGARFLIRTHVEVPTQNMMIAGSIGGGGSAIGDVFEGVGTANGVADKTLSGAAITANNGANVNIFPALILGQTRRASLFVMTDSRGFGTGDSGDGSGVSGEILRSLPGFAFIGAVVPGESLVGWLTNYSRRLALAQYATTVIGNMSINDITTPRTGAQLAADIQTVAALFPGKKVFWTTITPKTTSSDAWTTVANQTADATNAERVAANSLIRGGIPGVFGVFDIASVTESGLNSGLWGLVDGAPPTTDGLHGNYALYQKVRRSDVVQPNLIAR